MTESDPMPSQLIVVYNADGGIIGELTYVARKLLGRGHCSLCDITHGAVSEKRDWKACKTDLGVQLLQLHRNELSVEMEAAAGGVFPCVLAKRGDGFERVLGPAELDACGGDIPAFEALLQPLLEGPEGGN